MYVEEEKGPLAVAKENSLVSFELFLSICEHRYCVK